MSPGLRPEPGLLLELAPCGVLRVLLGAVVGDVEAAGRDLAQDPSRREAELADEQDAVLVVDGDDRDRARMAGDVALGARAVGALDGVDPERQVAAVMEDPGIDDVLDEIGPGGILRGRRIAGRSVGGQAAASAGCWMIVSPVSGSNRCTFSSGILRSTMSFGRTRWSESTIATRS